MSEGRLRYYTPVEAATVAGCTRENIHRAIRCGTLRSWVVGENAKGKQRQIREDWLASWMAARAQNTLQGGK
jgi:hypothetical protein